jgi:glycine/D-amino acid oxidase-like deaminating enzyme
VTGHGTAGMTLAPATGELAADIITGRPPAFDTSVLAPGRFGLGPQAREVLRRRGARAA